MIQYVPLPISTVQGNLSAYLAHGVTPPPVAGGKSRADGMWTGARSKEDKKSRAKQANVQWTLKPPYLHFRTVDAFRSPEVVSRRSHHVASMWASPADIVLSLWWSSIIDLIRPLLIVSFVDTERKFLSNGGAYQVQVR